MIVEIVQNQIFTLHFSILSFIMNYITFTSFIILLICIYSTQSCIIETKEKVNFNLTKIGGYGKMYFENSNTGIEFSVCQNVRGQCGNEDCNTFAGCMFDTQTIDEFCLGMDPVIEAHYLKIDKKSAIRIIYGKGDTHKEGCLQGVKSSLAIEIICDPDITDRPEKFELIEPDCKLGYYTVRFSHSEACVKKNGGLSGGSILLIIIFCSFAVYIIAGVIINKFVREKSGTDLFPNKSFWVGLPSLIKDGFNFMLCRRESSTYESIE